MHHRNCFAGVRIDTICGRRAVSRSLMMANRVGNSRERHPHQARHEDGECQRIDRWMVLFMFVSFYLIITGTIGSVCAVLSVE